MPDAGVITLEKQPDEGHAFGPAAPLVAEWRENRAGMEEVSAGSRVDRAAAVVRRWELEVAMLRDFHLTLPPETELLDESRMQDQLRWRDDALAEARRELSRARRVRRTMGTRVDADGSEKVYDAAGKWVEEALRSDGSLFAPGESIWSSRWLAELRQRFLDKPDESSASFLEKLEAQLWDSPPEVYLLMGELLFFHFLIVSTKNSAAEQRVINRVLGWSPAPAAIPDDLAAAMTPGLVNPGQNFHSGRPFQIGYLIEFVERWKEKGPVEQHRLLDHPWDFRDFAVRLDFRSELLKGAPNRPRTQREALLHLVFPDTFEPIVSVDHKANIARSFATLVADPDEDVDRQLAQIRPAIGAEYGYGDISFFSFYSPELRARWDDNSTPDLWDTFVGRARQYFNAGRLEMEEIEYKLETGRKLAEAREAVIAGTESWGGLVKNGISGNLIHPIEQSKFRNWIDGSPEEALPALRELWEGDKPDVGERIHRFCARFPRQVSSGSGVRMTAVSVLLMGLDVENYPPFRVTLFGDAYRRTGYAPPEPRSDEAALYEHALGFLDQFIQEASERDLPLRHRLDAQSLVWGIKSPDIEESDNRPEPIGGPWPPADIEGLANELLWEGDGLQKIIDGLKDKRQAIFQGPPGTGKTYVAKRIAEWCRDRGGDFEIVQFHPSYSYEDFVEGFRPTLTDAGQAGFKLTEGPLRRIAAKAGENPGSTFVLVIDEINRGNVAKVLGELYFLLEYRNETVSLQYSGDRFSLPENLWFIGTMNTTDRSIALVDAALRRRFYFFGFFPDEPPVRGLLSRWLEVNQPDARWVAGLVELANRKLEDRHLGIGPSYFLKKDQPLSEGRVRFIWEQAVIPYIEDQCFGDGSKLKEFVYDRLRRELGGPRPEPEGGSTLQEFTADEDTLEAEDGPGDASS